MFGWVRKFKKKVLPPEYEVQLHRVCWENPDPEGWYGPMKILSSWTPITVRGFEAAQIAEHRLRQDNRWGGQSSWPHVTIKLKEKEDG